MLLGLMIITIFLSGCASFQELDFDKPLIVLSDNKQAKPQEEKVWVEAKTSRIWVNPHVDENGDLVEGHYKHIITEAGHWEVKADERKQ